MSRKAKRQEIKKSLIIDAARRIFDEVGYEKTTLDLIGESVGLTKQTLYYYFASKEDLLLEVCLSSPETKPVESLRLSRQQGKAPSQLIAQYIEDSIYLVFNDISARLMVQYLPFASKSAKELVFQDLRAELDELEQIIGEGAASGEFTISNTPRIAAHIIQSNVHSLAYHQLNDKRLSAEKIRGSYLEILLGGLRSPANIVEIRSFQEPRLKQGAS